MINSINSFNSYMANEINANASKISQIKTRLKTGKIINTAGDNPTAVLTIPKFQMDIRQHQEIMNSLQNGIAMIDIAKSTINGVKNKQEALSGISAQYLQTASTAEKTSLLAKANGIITDIQNEIDNTFYKGDRLFNRQDHYIQTGMHPQNFLAVKFNPIQINTSLPNSSSGTSTSGSGSTTSSTGSTTSTGSGLNGTTTVYSAGTIPNTVDFTAYHKNRTFSGTLTFNQDGTAATYTIQVSKNQSITGTATVDATGLNSSKKNLVKLAQHLKVDTPSGTMNFDVYLKTLITQYGQQQTSPGGGSTTADNTPAILSQNYITDLASQLDSYKDDINKKREMLVRILNFQNNTDYIEKNKLSSITDIDKAKEMLNLIKEQAKKTSSIDMVQNFNNLNRSHIEELLSTTAQTKILYPDKSSILGKTTIENLYNTRKTSLQSLYPNKPKTSTQKLYGNASQEYLITSKLYKS